MKLNAQWQPLLGNWTTPMSIITKRQQLTDAQGKKVGSSKVEAKVVGETTV